MNIFNIYADVDAISMTPSRNTRCYTLRSVPSSPRRSFYWNFNCINHLIDARVCLLGELRAKWKAITFASTDEPVVGVCSDGDVAGEDDDQLGEGEVHQQPVDRGPELQQEN